MPRRSQQILRVFKEDLLPIHTGHDGEYLSTDGELPEWIPIGPHTHDGETLEFDGINSDGGAFAFTTTGTVTFNQEVNVKNLEIIGNYYFRWRNPADTVTYAYEQANVANFIISAVNVPMKLQYGGVGGAIGAQMDAAGNWIFNHAAADCDFTIKKDTAGDAYIYDAGSDKHTFSGTTNLATCINAGVDTDKFLVLDAGGNIDFRTGAEVLADVDAAASVHTHDGDTLQLDGVNSDGGAFAFTTTGDITLNHNIILPDDGSIGVADGDPKLLFDNTDGKAELTGIFTVSKYMSLADAAAQSNIILHLHKVWELTSAIDNTFRDGIGASVQVGKTGAAAFTSHATGLSVTATVNNPNTQNWTNTFGLRGAEINVTTESSTTGTITGAVGILMDASFQDSVDVTNYYGIRMDEIYDANNKLVNSYGIYLEDFDKATTLNYAIYTNAGKVRLGDTVTLATCINAGADVDKFLVRDATGNVDFRTGANVLSDLSGDAAATFDWNGQSLTGIENITATSATSTKPILTLENTNADGVGCNFIFKKTSTSQANWDALGTFSFRGLDSNSNTTIFAKIQANSPVVLDGSEEGSFMFRVMKAGTERNYIQLKGSGIILNEDGQDIDFRVEGTSNANLLKCNAGNNRVGICTANPGQAFDVNQGSGNMIADGYDAHSLGCYKENIKPVETHGRIEKLKAFNLYEFTRKPYVSADELRKAVINKFGKNRWVTAFGGELVKDEETGEVTIHEDDYHSGKMYECPDAEMLKYIDKTATAKRAELRKLPLWQRKHLGLIADDADTIANVGGVISRDEDENIVGYSLGNYTSFLHGAILELINKVTKLEEAIAHGN